MEFVKFNANPKGRKTGDCVVRAICTALNESWEEKIQKVMKDSNTKKTAGYQSEHKNYEFIIDNEKYYFDIIKDELRCKRHNREMIKYFHYFY